MTDKSLFVLVDEHGDYGLGEHHHPVAWHKPDDGFFRYIAVDGRSVREYVPLSRAEAAEQALAEARAENERLKEELRAATVCDCGRQKRVGVCLICDNDE